MTGKITPFTMPKWGIEMEEGVIREWHANEGDIVKEGDLFVVIETDKIANDVELEFTGTLRKRIGQEEDVYPVGALIAVFADADVSENEIEAFVASFKAADAGFSNRGDETDQTASDEASSQESNSGAAQAKTASLPDGMLISPKAAELAVSLGVDLADVKGSGRNGRVSLQDVEQAGKKQGKHGDVGMSPPSFEVVKLSSMRRTIAKRLSEAAQSVPQFYVRSRLNLDPLVSLRTERKASGEKAPSVTDYLIKACAKTLKVVPDVNVHFAGDAIHRFPHADINVAVSVPGGLIAPVIRRAEMHSVEEISTLLQDLADRARSENLSPAEYQSGSFSLSNLGMYGVNSFDAFINPPMAAILAVGTIERQATEHGGFQSVMTATLTCDHRAIDGALAGEFLMALSDFLAKPESL